ncbi:hypothetical protein MMC10_005879 [Thelotrema lepadinum]|nr:hypothetical protein [Thelotrema lepadinum]
MSTSPKTFLVSGLTPQPGAKSYKGLSEPEMHALLSTELQKLRDIGLDPSLHLIDNKSTSAMEDWKAVLSSKRWDGVSIGFGVRGSPELTELFEDLVNAVIEVGGRQEGGAPKMCFAMGPDTQVPNAKRVMLGEK